MWTIEVKGSDYRERPWLPWVDVTEQTDGDLESILRAAFTWKAQGQAVRISWEEQ